MKERQFPILGDDKSLLGSVPWALVEAHAKQCGYNHGQSVSTLASRGGLSLSELAAVLEDRPWHRMLKAAALDVVKQFLDATRTD